MLVTWFAAFLCANGKLSCIEKSIEISKTCQQNFYTQMMRTDGRDCNKHFEKLEMCLSTGLTCHARTKREFSDKDVRSYNL